MEDPNEKISLHFTWYEALWLPQWKRLATLEDGLTEQVAQNLTDLFEVLDLVREFFASPIVVHCAYRPEAYNKQVGGAQDSTHMARKQGEAAVDFHIKGIPCGDAIKSILDNDMLTPWGLRMENNGPNPAWVHLDTRRPYQMRRYFKP